MTYPILSVVLPYLLIGIVLWLLMPWLDAGKAGILHIAASVMLIIVSVDMYESHASVLLTAYFAVLFIKYYYSDDNGKKFRNICIPSLKIVGLLACAIVLERIISKILCRIFCGTFEFWYGQITLTAWQEKSVIDVLKWLFRELIGRYLIAGVSNYSVAVYDAAVFAGFITVLVVSVRRKNRWLAVLYAGAAVSSMSLAVVLGTAPAYRMAQAIPILSALFAALIVMLLPEKSWLKSMTWCIIGIMVFNQTLLINRYTVLNYERYQYENNILQNIAKDLQEYPIDEKSVLFVSKENHEFPRFEATPLDLNNPVANAYRSFMYRLFDAVLPNTTFRRLDSRHGWKVDYDLLNSAGVDRFYNEDDYILAYTRYIAESYCAAFTPEVYTVFSKLGCPLIVDEVSSCSDYAEYLTYCGDYENMPAYPTDGYIVETDERIIVKIYN